MTDMLVKLYALPEIQPLLQALHEKGLEIRRAHPSEKQVVMAWVGKQFEEGWAKECETAVANQPSSCFIAIKKDPAHVPTDDPYNLPDEILVGFACYDATSKGMFGPLGVHKTARKQGLGKALLLTCLYAMKEAGYAYAVIGWVASEKFYAEAVRAITIPDSAPGIYRGRLVGAEG